MNKLLSDYFKWVYFSTYHPSMDTDVVLRDFLGGKSLAAVYAERGLVWPPDSDHEAQK